MSRQGAQGSMTRNRLARTLLLGGSLMIGLALIAMAAGVVEFNRAMYASGYLAMLAAGVGMWRLGRKGRNGT